MGYNIISYNADVMIDYNIIIAISEYNTKIIIVSQISGYIFRRQFPVMSDSNNLFHRAHNTRPDLHLVITYISVLIILCSCLYEYTSIYIIQVVLLLYLHNNYSHSF